MTMIAETFSRPQLVAGFITTVSFKSSRQIDDITAPICTTRLVYACAFSQHDVVIWSISEPPVPWMTPATLG